MRLPNLEGELVSLDEALREGPLVAIFVHGDCPTSVMTLRRIAALDPHELPRVLCIVEDSPEGAARLARHAGLRLPVVAQPAPYETSRSFDVHAVPTMLALTQTGEVADRVVGWSTAEYERVLNVSLGDEPPAFKPGCGSRWTYDPDAAGLDEFEDMFERGWTDGLPVVPPTEERVETMLAGRDPAASLGVVPPGMGEATLQRVAACAVLAGCRPEYFPVVATAVELMLDPTFNLNGQAVTTSPPTQIVLVNGPIREQLGLNSGTGALGPGWRANMTIGRAVRLVVTLTGEAAPGRLDRASLGHPGKLGMCLAEDEEGSPWPPFHVERGFPGETSTVTVFAGDAPTSTAHELCLSAEDHAATLGWAAEHHWCFNWWPLNAASLFVLCPNHARVFADAGWDKRRTKEAMFASVRRRAGELAERGPTPPELAVLDPETALHKWRSPDDIELFVAGDRDGRFSAVIGPADGMDARTLTREVAWTAT